VLKSDGTYTQLIDINRENGTLIHSGTWKYNSVGNDVQLLDPILVDDNFGSVKDEFRKPMPGIWSLEPVRKMFSFSLRWNPDWDYEFRRI